MDDISEERGKTFLWLFIETKKKCDWKIVISPILFLLYSASDSCYLVTIYTLVYELIDPAPQDKIIYYTVIPIVFPSSLLTLYTLNSY